MAIRNTSTKNTLATSYKTALPYGALFSADPGTSGSVTGEITGGGYARVALSWGTASGGVITSAATTFNVASGTTVTYFGATASGTTLTYPVIVGFAPANAEMADWERTSHGKVFRLPVQKDFHRG